MNYASLHTFVDKASERQRIDIDDVRRLARDILPDGIATREQADLLIGLDRAATKVDPAWSRWLLAAMVDYAVWGARPTGIIDAETAAWLNAALAGEGVTERGTAILYEIAREAETVDASLIIAGQRRSMRADRTEAGPIEAGLKTLIAPVPLTA